MTLWNRCVDRLEGDLPPQQFNTWIRPLQAVEEDGQIRLLAPNQFVLDWVKKNYLKQITVYAAEISQDRAPRIVIEIGTRSAASNDQKRPSGSPSKQKRTRVLEPTVAERRGPPSNINPRFTFETFVEGKSNQLART